MSDMYNFLDVDGLQSDDGAQGTPESKTNETQVSNQNERKPIKGGNSNIERKPYKGGNSITEPKANKAGSSSLDGVVTGVYRSVTRMTK